MLIHSSDYMAPAAAGSLSGRGCNRFSVSASVERFALCLLSQHTCMPAGTSFWGIGNNRTTQGGVIAISGALFAATVIALPSDCVAPGHANNMRSLASTCGI